AHTLLMYFPWSVNLTKAFRKNINDMEKSISENGLYNQRVLVFFASAPAEATLFEIKRNDLGIVSYDTLASYPSHPYTTVSGISKMINDVKEAAPAKNYSLIIGAHGMSWLPVSRASGMMYSIGKEAPFVEHWNMDVDEENPILTRYFGGTTAAYQTDISTLVDALKESDTHMQYILFDDCFMSSIEVAYELRNSADYLIASTCEIMAYGMPYHKIGKYLLGEPDYANIVNEFYNFYSGKSPMPAGTLPCGTIGVINLKEMEKMAFVMNEINAVSQEGIKSLNADDIQTFDGYNPTIFFDYGHYVENICKKLYPELYTRFSEQLMLTVPYKRATETYYSQSSGRQHKIDNYSGINTTEPSKNTQSTKHYYKTPWYQATHN
ncbi:MAG: Clostripain family protein, partial [Muribaculaceae bacterium]|nr:Clostripain family protein [Muribaculaceae bacterium]